MSEGDSKGCRKVTDGPLSFIIIFFPRTNIIGITCRQHGWAKLKYLSKILFGKHERKETTEKKNDIKKVVNILAPELFF